MTRLPRTVMLACVVSATACLDFGELGGGATNDGGVDGVLDGGVGDSAGDSDSTGSDGGACTGTCTDTYAELATDPCNCGMCGHGCQGAACVAGACQAIPIAPAGVTNFSTGYDSSTLPYIAVDNTNMYWYDANQLASCPKSGCVHPTHLSMALISPGPIVLDATTVYFGDGKSLLACAKSGCAQPKPLITLSGTATMDGYAIDQTNVYASSDTSNSAAIVRCPKSGCVGSPTTIYTRSPASGIGGLADFLVVQTKLVWQDGTDGFNNGYSWFESCTLPNCSDAAVYQPNAASAPFSDGTNVYWDSINNSYYLSMCPITGCSTPVAQELLADMVGATLRGSNIFAIANFYSGNVIAQRKIVTCPAGACTSWTQLASTSSSSYVAVDSTSVYWIDGTSVMRMVSP